jgi:glycosyltransferase involved in cell wall biosynthesis
MGLESPTVTVIIATYNRSRILRYAIESALWQTFRDFELWVIGDGCTDDTEQIVASFDDPRVHWYNLPENTGYESEPHNEGIRRAKGKYIAYLNYDDLWMPNHLQALVERIEETCADFVSSILEIVPLLGDPKAIMPEVPRILTPPEVSATIHRRDVVDRVGFWKPASESYSTPHIEYFRQAQFKGMHFELAPALTAIKFEHDSNNYTSHEQSRQAEFLEKIRNDPEFAHKELARLYIRAWLEIRGPFSLWRLRYQLEQSIRKLAIRFRIDPARLLLWNSKGKVMDQWHRSLGLGSDPSRTQKHESTQSTVE